MAIEAIFFDTSDTLYHSPEFEDAQSKRPILQLSEARKIPYDQAKALFKKTKEELTGKMVHVPKVAVMMELGISRLEMQQYLGQVDSNQYLQHDEQLNSMLGRLHEKYQLGIITNILAEFLYRILDSLGVDRTYFRHIVSVDNTEHSKPHEEPFLKAIELTGVKPEQCVYVGDSLTKDIIPAKKAGMRTVWMSKEAKEDGHVDVPISSIYELEGALSKL